MKRSCSSSPGPARAAGSGLRAQRPDIAARLDALRKVARPLAVRLLRGPARRRQRTQEITGAPRLGGRRRPRRISQSGARLRKPRNAIVQGFVAWLRSASAEVKRDMEMARDEVRVMTVHGAKGLEAPIVILADTTTPPQGFIRRGFAVAGGRRRAPLVWVGADQDNTAVRGRGAADGTNEGDEYRRLLYVAMTRAIERLIVCGSMASTGGRRAAGTISPAGARRTVRRRKGDDAQPTSGVIERCIRRSCGGRRFGNGKGRHHASRLAEGKACRTDPHRTAQAFRLRRRSKHCWSVAAARGAAARNSPRQHRAPADAVVARNPARSQAPPPRANTSPGRKRISRHPNATRSSSRHWRF